jgi:hypothetical protein
LGITYDFSTNISATPVNYKGITFFPYPQIGQWHGNASEYRHLILSLRYPTSVLTIHPSLMVNRSQWDLIYAGRNPKQLFELSALSSEEIEWQFHEFDLLLRRIERMEKLQLVEVTPTLEKPLKTKALARINVSAVFERSMVWAREVHRYEPKYLKQHFIRFFETLQLK